MTHGSLFTGIGGFDLAAEWAGIETIFQVEIDEFCLKVLNKHWPDVPKYKDIYEFNKAKYKGTVDIISGGFPCQPVSLAGFRKGSNDNRWFWPEMLRICEEFKPGYIITENVAGIVSLGLPSILSDLENLQYKNWVFDIPAYSVDLPTLERHIWIISKAISQRYERSKKKQNKNNGIKRKFQRTNQGIQNRWNISESEFCRVDKRVSDKLDRHQRKRLKSLGNAIIPQIAFLIFEAIKQVYEKNTEISE